MTSTYSSVAYASMWNPYRGTRLVVGCMIIKMAGYISALNSGLAKGTHAWLEYVRRSQQELVDGICASVPFILDSGDDAANTYRVFALSWSFIITLAVETIPDGQRRWIRDQLRFISTITASTIFE